MEAHVTDCCWKHCGVQCSGPVTCSDCSESTLEHDTLHHGPIETLEDTVLPFTMRPNHIEYHHHRSPDRVVMHADSINSPRAGNRKCIRARVPSERHPSCSHPPPPPPQPRHGHHGPDSLNSRYAHPLAIQSDRWPVNHGLQWPVLIVLLVCHQAGRFKLMLCLFE